MSKQRPRWSLTAGVELLTRLLKPVVVDLARVAGQQLQEDGIMFDLSDPQTHKKVHGAQYSSARTAAL